MGQGANHFHRRGFQTEIHNDAMVIEVNIAGWIIGKVLVDNGSSADILFMKTFEKMNLSQHMLHPPEYPLQGFGGKPIKPVGKISLLVSFGDLDNARTENLTFDVVDILRTMCGSRTGGWSLPCVMSD
jgi:hypothetical protein